MTEMQVKCAHPERTVVGHPFNPPYLIPLVEVVGGEQTTRPRWSRGPRSSSRHAGKSVITMDREVPGFIANRLQEALWREALHMVAAGEATVEQIDLSITDGPGLRWPVQGPMLTFHLAGGQGGMAHMLDHFGPSLQSPWTRLEAAELTPELRDEVVDGLRARGGRPHRSTTWSPSATRRDRGAARTRPRMSDPTGSRSSGASRCWTSGSTTTATSPSRTTCWCSGHATDAVMDAVGLGPEYRAAHDASLFTVEAHVRYLDQVAAGVDARGRARG